MFIYKSSLICLALLFASCGSQEWRLGGAPHDIKTIKRRDKERDVHLKYRLDQRWDTTKHYVKQHKKKDGKVNLFKRDGFDIGF